MIVNNGASVSTKNSNNTNMLPQGYIVKHSNKSYDVNNPCRKVTENT